MKVGLGADHGGSNEAATRRAARKKGTRSTATRRDTDDDYPDLHFQPVPLHSGVERHLSWRSGVGASVAANKVPGARAALCHDDCSARQGVEDDNRNILCFGGRTTGIAVAWDCTKNFLGARFSGADRHRRRLSKVLQFEASQAASAHNSE